MDVRNWLKGNTHTHTLRSDGDATIAQAVAAYAGRGYDFLVITDHNRYIRRDELAARQPAGLLVIPGCELSIKSPTSDKPVHVCDVAGQAPDSPGHEPVPLDADVATRLRVGVEMARSAGGLPVVAHPCWHWALSADDLLTIDGEFLLEVWNPSTDCNNHPAGGADSPEDIWSRLLSAGRRVWAVAADDVHRIVHSAIPPINSAAMAWIRVGAAERTESAVLAAMRAGRLYASTGVELAEWTPGPGRYALRVQPVRNYKYTIFLLGRDNRELTRVHGTEASWTPRGDELFIRARVEDTDGSRCWTQPWFL